MAHGDLMRLINRTERLHCLPNLLWRQVWQRQPSPQLAGVLARIPGYPLNLALIKLSYASFGEFDWKKLTLPKQMLPVVVLMKKLLTRFPFLQSFLKPPTHLLPPVDLFNTRTFETLFIAEQHTLVPVFILIEPEYHPAARK